jgi:hypothetical protein
VPPLTAHLRQVAAILLPGDGNSPSANDLPDYTDLLSRAVEAIGSESDALEGALSSLPERPTMAVLEQFSIDHPKSFELVAATVAGAYFMSPTVLTSIGYVIGERSAARFDQAAEELGTGLLHPVLERTSR